MADIASPLWLQNFRRQAGVRRAIVVHGNVQDLALSPASGDYVAITDLLAQVLGEMAFDHVVRWNRADGMLGISEDARARMIADASGVTTTGADATDSYDMGAVSPAPVMPQSCDPQDFFRIVQQRLHAGGRERTAFVIDWSQYLFGSANNLSEAERQWLLLLSAATSAPLETGNDNLARPSSLFVLVCPRIGAIPPVFLQNNPAVTDIVVPAPVRGEREEFLRRTARRWALNENLTPGTATFADFVDALEGLTIRDLQQLMKMSRQSGPEPLKSEALCNLYRFGDRKSPWEDLNHAKLRALVPGIGERVIGQDEALRKINQVIIRAFTGLSGLQHSKKQRMPKGTLFFVGPTGVGKTELAKALAAFLFGDEDACIRFDMSEFNHEHSDQRLVGAPPGYVGYEEGGQLTNAVKRRPFSVLLFDEIEKAHPRILDKFLQILEDGRLTDGKGDTVSFAESVIIFTSNIGAADVQISDDASSVRQAFLAQVQHHFVHQMKRPELLNRIGDNIVPFNFITVPGFLANIARSKLAPLRRKLHEKYGIRDLAFRDETAAMEAIAGTTETRMGGRGVLNQLSKHLIDPLAEFLFEYGDDPGYLRGKGIRVMQRTGTAQFVFDLED
jgi:energy-coupling factor transporter ATP-binding protein EcfA2